MMKLHEDLELVRSNSGRRSLWKTARGRLSSHSKGLGMRRDLSQPIPVPPTKVPVDVRPLRPDDDLALIADVPGLTPEEAQLRADQRWILSANIPTCWVAVDRDGFVCFMTFLFLPKDNARIQEWWGGQLPELRSDEAMIEGSFGAESYRRLGVVSHAAGRVTELASEFGARYVVTFMSKDNVGAIKAASKAGFTPYVERHESSFLFRRRFRFVPID